MNIEAAQYTPDNLMDTLIESRSFKRNKLQWIVFYGSSFATAVMFVILCSLSIWTLTLAHEINHIVTKSTAILNDVEEMMPVMRAICQHDNFTESYGHICTF